MKKALSLLVLLFLGCPGGPAGTDVREGDIIFQVSQSPQSRAIQLATGSRYTHVGIVFRNGGGLSVLEAVQPVKYTPLKEWIAKGENSHYVVKRLRGAEDVLKDEVVAGMKETAEAFLGRNYDLYFEWSDERLYCSELVWKVYRRSAGVEIGRLHRLGDFNLKSDAVRKKLGERYGEDIPVDEMVISPGDMFQSKKLVTVLAE